MIFPIGLKMDVILISYLSFLPAVVLSLIPGKLSQYFNKFLFIYFIVLLSLILFMEAVTPEFVKQYDTRPNKLFLDYLIYPSEVAKMLLKGHVAAVISVLVIFVAALYFGIKKGRKLFRIPENLPEYKFRLILFPVLGFLLFWGARGSLTAKRPLNPSSAIFSNDQLTNVMGLNSLYTVIYAAYGMKNEANIEKLYGKMDESEAINRVKKYMCVPDSLFTDPDIPLLHEQEPDTLIQRPYNLVILLQESLGAEFIGCLGGMPLTPELDKLSEEGLLFTRLYCTGTRSVRGIEAVVTGFIPSPSESVVKLSNSQSGFFTLASLLKRAGYNTSFIYGGMGNFDNMASFFNGNGFDNIIDETVFDKDDNKYAFKGTWGYSDEDLVTKANEYYKSMGDKPFFSMMFSSSNHDPFEFPDGRIGLYEQPKNSLHNAIKYADFSIGKFFELAKKEAYYKHTVFIVIADHNTRTYGKNLVPVNKFHIPALVVGAGITEGSTYDKLCSQIDIPPTLLSMIGMKVETPMPGRNLQSLPEAVEGRSIMQFHDINAFRVEDRVVILQPDKEPLQFEIKNDTTLIPAPLDMELAKDALGHVISAGNLYKKKLYRLPDSDRH
jgi:phosphoglycerol transferase MdoB-like AlkP superfamily enzyme